MKTGRTLTQLAQEIERQQKSKYDVVVSTGKLTLELPDAKHSDGGFIEGFNAVQTVGNTRTQPRLGFISPDGVPMSYIITPHTHRQIAAHLKEDTKLPKDHYDYLLGRHPDLLSVMVNTLFRRHQAARLVRTLDGNARAFLSNRYRPIDNADVAEVALNVMHDSQATIASCEITESRLYLKALFPKTEGEVAKGDVVQMGVVIKNSEIGLGRFVVEPLIYRLACLNGMIMQDGAIARTHLGSRQDLGADGWAREFKQDTLRAMDRTLMLQVRDTMAALATPEKMQGFVERFRAAAQNRIEGDVVAGVQVLQKKAGLTDDDRGGILRHLINGGDLSQWGLANAVTRYSQDVSDYDKATDLESLGGQIIEMKPTDWTAIATATGRTAA